VSNGDGTPLIGLWGRLLRHTFATHALRARPNLRAVQELLGHAWVTTTQRYTHLEVEDLQDQVAELPGNRGRGAS
jgi:integrase/recombinase XerC